MGELEYSSEVRAGGMKLEQKRVGSLSIRGGGSLIVK